MSRHVDRKLFEGTAHNPSLFTLARSMGVSTAEILDFCVPCNPYFPTDEIRARLVERLHDLVTYYPSDIEVISNLLADTMSLDPATVVAANGSDELIAWIDELMIKDGLCTSIPTFNRWFHRPRAMGRPVHLHQLPPERDFRFDGDEFVREVRASGMGAAVIVNPNNPTGYLIPADEMERVLEQLATLELVVVDESFIDFAHADGIPSCVGLVERFPNLIVLKSLGKNLGLHGLRLGYAICRPDRARLLRNAMPRWSVNALAEAVIRELGSHGSEYEAARQRIVRERDEFQLGLEQIPGLHVLPSWCNFVTFRVPDGWDAELCRDRLLSEHSIYVRECGNKDGMGPGYIRVASREPEDNQRLLEALHAMWAKVAQRTPPARVELEFELPVATRMGDRQMLHRAIALTVDSTLEPGREPLLPSKVADLVTDALDRMKLGDDCQSLWLRFTRVLKRQAGNTDEIKELRVLRVDRDPERNAASPRGPVFLRVELEESY